MEKDSETVAEECVEQMAGGHSENKTADVPFVEFRDVTFGYDEHVVLDHLNLKVMDAEQVTLAGRTGAGKSTILKLLLGLYEPQGGGFDPRKTGSDSPGGRETETVRLCRTDLPHGSGNGARSDHAV